MGDLCDQADIERYMRSVEGQAHLSKIRRELVGRRINAVLFSNHISIVGISIVLDDDNVFDCQTSELDVGALRERFESALDREFEQDYPERCRK